MKSEVSSDTSNSSWTQQKVQSALPSWSFMTQIISPFSASTHPSASPEINYVFCEGLPQPRKSRRRFQTEAGAVKISRRTKRTTRRKLSFEWMPLVKSLMETWIINEIPSIFNATKIYGCGDVSLLSKLFQKRDSTFAVTSWVNHKSQSRVYASVDF